MKLPALKPTPMLLNQDECDALGDALHAKADAALATGDRTTSEAYRDAATMLHNARLASFQTRSAANRRRHRQALSRL